MIGDEEIEEELYSQDTYFSIEGLKFAKRLNERLHSAETALRFYAQKDPRWNVEVWEFSQLVDRGEKAREHFARIMEKE